ncbi:MAG: phage tail protein [Rhodobacteraceae bacterium]|jgi:hypothetical protein|nr:phage tail protein [Paracoccaceae bacterium]
MSVLAVYREPFGFAPRVFRLPEGETLAQMAARVRALPPDFAARGVICINGRQVERRAWSLIKPKPQANGIPVEVTFHCAPRGGGEDGGKSVLALVASIALTVASGFVAGGGLAGLLGPKFAAGTLGATVLAAGVGLAGSLLVSALIPPPALQRGADAKRITNLGAASAEGNLLEPNAAIPRVAGVRKVFPPLLAEPLTYFDGPDEVVEAVYALSGPHMISDVRIGAAKADDMTDVEVETREGWPGSDLLTIVSRFGRTEPLQSELRGHTVSDSDGRTLDSTTGDITSALPQAQILATREGPDEQLLHLTFPQGLHKNASETDRVRVPIRLRLRPVGSSTWTELPELHFQAANLRQLRATIRLIWADDASTTPGAATTEGWVEARRFAPGQTNAPAQADWEADAYFSTGSGDVFLTASNLGTTGVDHVILDRFTAAIYLDTATFPRGRYEIEIRRGAPFLASAWSASAYTISGTVWDLFFYQGTPQRIPITKDGIADTLYLLRSVSVWNRHPAPSRDLALIAVRARNRALDRVSAVVGGYVRDWDGAAWADWAVTSNPAPHLRDIWTGAQNLRPIPVSLIDDDGLVAWRTACATAGYEVNALFEGQTVADAAQIAASCGYARPMMSEVWGVARDYDRSAEAPVQIFTPRNSANFGWKRAFPIVPDAFRVTFRDASRDYEARQITVARTGSDALSEDTEQVTYEGLVTEAEVRAKAVYDQLQPVYRGTFYSLDAPAEALVCRKGDLVGVQHDMLTQHAGYGRIIDLDRDGSGDVVSVTLDGPVPITNEPYMDEVADLSVVPDLSLLGVSSSAAVRRTVGGVTVHALSNATGEHSVLVFAAPVAAAGMIEGVLVAVGRSGREYLRLIVFDVQARPNFEASLTLVDEAPELWAA